MSKYSLFDCPRILVIFVIYEYNFMIARPFLFVVYVDMPCLYLCTWWWRVVLLYKRGNCFEW